MRLLFLFAFRNSLFSIGHSHFNNVRILCLFSGQCFVYVPSSTKLLSKSTRSKTVHNDKCTYHLTIMYTCIVHNISNVLPGS